MKKLLIIRHAKSSWDNPEMDDFDRPLNDRGKRDAPIMAKRLKEHHIYPDLMISSPAVRALVTCKMIAEGIGYPDHTIVIDRALYHAGEDQVLSVVKKIDDHHEVVMLFGHNPGLTEFAGSLTNEDILNIPTCGIVAIDLPVRHWQDVAFGCGKKSFFDFPKNKP